MPKIPNIYPGRGVGNLKSLKLLGPNLWISSFDIFFDKLRIFIASNGHLFTHIPHPIHLVSFIKQTLELGNTLMHKLVSKPG